MVQCLGPGSLALRPREEYWFVLRAKWTNLFRWKREDRQNPKPSACQVEPNRDSFVLAMLLLLFLQLRNHPTLGESQERDSLPIRQRK